MAEKSKHLDIKIALCVVLACGIALGIIDHRYKKQEKQKEIARQEQRGKDFANYIIEDTQKWVAENQDVDKITQQAQEYINNPTEYDEQINKLVQDSTKYANAIFRDAGVINNLDLVQKRTVPFEEAIEFINAQKPEYPSVRKKPELHIEYDGFGEMISWVEYVPKDTIVEYNTSPARIMKINKRHLRNISLDLATRRAGRRR